MSSLLLPQGRIPLGFATINGQKVSVEIDQQWMRWATTLTERAGGIVAPNNIVTYIGSTVAPSVVLDIGGDDGDFEFIPGPPGPAADIDLALTITTTTAITARSGTFLIDTTAGNVALTLPANGLVYRIKRITAGGNTLTISPVSGNIDGAASMALVNQYESVTLKSDGTDFWIV